MGKARGPNAGVGKGIRGSWTEDGEKLGGREMVSFQNKCKWLTKRNVHLLAEGRIND